MLFIGGVGAAFIYLLRDPGAPLNVPVLSAPAKAMAAPDKKPGTNARDVSKVDAILESVNNLLRGNQISQAEAVLNQAIVEHPGDQRLYVTLAEMQLTKEDYSGAYESYVKALATGERTAKLEFQAGTVASMVGKNDRALEHYSAAQTADKANAEYPLYLGQVQLQMGKLDEARASLVRSAQLNPDDGRAWGSLAEIALRENKLDVALQNVGKARSLQPRITVWRLIEARIHARAGHPEKSVELLMPLEPTDKSAEPIARVLADALSMLKRDAEAAEVLEAASDASPKDRNLAFDAAVRARKAGDEARFGRLRERALHLGHPDAADLKGR